MWKMIEILFYGYLVVEPKFQMNTLLIHWAHTKPIYRRQGVYKALLNNYLGFEDPITVVILLLHYCQNSKEI